MRTAYLEGDRQNLRERVQISQPFLFCQSLANEMSVMPTNRVNTLSQFGKNQGFKKTRISQNQGFRTIFGR